jgi:hypothetical protein
LTPTFQHYAPEPPSSCNAITRLEKELWMKAGKEKLHSMNKLMSLIYPSYNKIQKKVAQFGCSKSNMIARVES